MAEPVPSLSILKDSLAARELDLVSELFHRINRVIPVDQEVLSIEPDTPVRVAVERMRRQGYSQIPVVENEVVLGVFSFRSFAIAAAAATLDLQQRQRRALGELEVSAFMEPFDFARVTDEMVSVFGAMERDNGILIGAQDRLIGILTPMDFLTYLYKVASPFVVVSEIELALRALIRLVLDEEGVAKAALRSLHGVYGEPEKIPTTLEEMTFDNYQTLIGNGDNWKELASVLGGTREIASGKLKQIGEIRNDLFHFRRELGDDDREALAEHRRWILSRIRLAEARGRGGVSR